MNKVKLIAVLILALLGNQLQSQTFQLFDADTQKPLVNYEMELYQFVYDAGFSPNFFLASIETDEKGYFQINSSHLKYELILKTKDKYHNILLNLGGETLAVYHYLKGYGTTIGRVIYNFKTGMKKGFFSFEEDYEKPFKVIELFAFRNNRVAEIKEEILAKNYHLPENQEKLWMILWNSFFIDVYPHITPPDCGGLWHTYAVAIFDDFEVDIPILLEAIEDSPSWEQRYYLLYVICREITICSYKDCSIDKSIIDTIKWYVAAFYQQSGRLTWEDNWREKGDAMKNAFQNMLKRVE